MSSNNAPCNKFECKICGKIYKRRLGLTRHAMTIKEANSERLKQYSKHVVGSSRLDYIWSSPSIPISGLFLRGDLSRSSRQILLRSQNSYYCFFPRQKGKRSSSKAREIIEKFAENIREEFILKGFNRNVITLKNYQVIKESEKQLTRAQKRKQNNDGNKRTKQIKDK
ncbi:hypothetical protein RhiirC2_794824 [Rhizophagus irregularis]|uniref:C2H2-type domain-containing protein n=1 Tax=Rhizophagus irregularis TaxID=588596 RepID=A0A2N1MCU4_9GLOM|nr:hypothetical protein RhiirC2_794824 [Rhizophagus irregularis]